MRVYRMLKNSSLLAGAISLLVRVLNHLQVKRQAQRQIQLIKQYGGANSLIGKRSSIPSLQLNQIHKQRNISLKKHPDKLQTNNSIKVPNIGKKDQQNFESKQLDHDRSIQANLCVQTIKQSDALLLQKTSLIDQNDKHPQQTNPQSSTKLIVKTIPITNTQLNSDLYPPGSPNIGLKNFSNNILQELKQIPSEGAGGGVSVGFQTQAKIFSPVYITPTKYREKFQFEAKTRPCSSFQKSRHDNLMKYEVHPSKLNLHEVIPNNYKSSTNYKPEISIQRTQTANKRPQGKELKVQHSEYCLNNAAVSSRKSLLLQQIGVIPSSRILHYNSQYSSNNYNNQSMQRSFYNSSSKMENYHNLLQSTSLSRRVQDSSEKWSYLKRNPSGSDYMSSFSKKKSKKIKNRKTGTVITIRKRGEDTSTTNSSTQLLNELSPAKIARANKNAYTCNMSSSSFYQSKIVK